MTGIQPVSLLVVLIGATFMAYTYLGYPFILWILGFFKGKPGSSGNEPHQWPLVSLSVPAHNEELQIEGLIRNLLALDYPKNRLQILVVSDASTDRTDEIVQSFFSNGVELLQMPERGGKTRAENAAAEHLRGEIIVNTDASIRIEAGAIKSLVMALQDPEVGLASGRDVSVAPGEGQNNAGESGYVGYEMAVRDLETRVSGIVGASGSLYAIRPSLHRIPLPDFLSRDFAAALLARENGYKSVSVPEALCFVPRTSALKNEYRRKVRTMTRGIHTLAHKRSLLNPLRFGLFAWKLLSHKVCRWAMPWVAAAVFLALAVLSPYQVWAMGLFLSGLLLLVLAGIGWAWPSRSVLPGILSLPAFLVAGNLAAMSALVHFLRGVSSSTWEPTRRKTLDSPTESS